LIDLRLYGYIETEAPPVPSLLPARITEQQRDQYTVITTHGECAAILKGAFLHNTKTHADYPSVGDFVWLDYSTNGMSRIVSLVPRRSKFARADYGGRAAEYAKTVQEQVVAANFDAVFVLSSLNRDFNVNRILRYITQARHSGAQPVVVLTKADVAAEIDIPMQEVRTAAPDVPVYAVSSHTGCGLDALEIYLRPGRTVVFLGMSGVGKSSLLNALMQKEVAAVSGIREDDARGRHTTTYRALFMLPSGAMVIDTPGMRELGLIDAEESVSAGFADVEALFVACRFNDCRHRTEPGCAIQAALADGTLSQERWQRYHAQKRETKFADDKAEYLREKTAWHKDIALWNKQRRKNGGPRKR